MTNEKQYNRRKTDKELNVDEENLEVICRVESVFNPTDAQCEMYMFCTPLETEKYNCDSCETAGKKAYENCGSPGKNRFASEED